ncbi:MAG: hypothetical protein IPK80_12855 [Nannocystis sp.]|nr:hypothetical protein [Nannocystis sp.]
MTLRRELAGDRERLREQADTLRAREVTPTSDEVLCDAVAMTLHRLYAAVEKLFERVADHFEGKPQGPSWHRDLFVQVGSALEGRPAVISSEEVKAALGELLRFRHYVIHGSVSIAVDGERLVGLRERVLDALKGLEEDLDRFDAFLAQRG